jgi:hypothetical protein
MDCARTGDFRLFGVLSEGYMARIRELNAEICEYLQVSERALVV